MHDQNLDLVSFNNIYFLFRILREAAKDRRPSSLLKVAASINQILLALLMHCMQDMGEGRVFPLKSIPWDSDKLSIEKILIVDSNDQPIIDPGNYKFIKGLRHQTKNLSQALKEI
jgi:hypothetical protein